MAGGRPLRNIAVTARLIGVCDPAIMTAATEIHFWASTPHRAKRSGFIASECRYYT